MTTERELLTFAAKAAGATEINGNLYVPNCSEGKSLFNTDGWVNTGWNPLTDDGDALRLAVKLGLDVEMHGCLSTFPYAYAFAPDKTVVGDSEEEHDPYAATRRAIARAAAEIGRNQHADQ